MKRLSIEISNEQDDFLYSIPWGYKCQLIRALISLSMDAVRKYGLQIIPDMINKKCSIVYGNEIEDGK